MKRIALSWLLGMLLAIGASPQTVSGILEDSLTQTPIKFGTVSIRSPGVDTALRSTVTDQRGRFRLVKLIPGDFELLVTSVGYNAKRFLLCIPAGSDVVNLGTLFVSIRRELLKEVVVNSKRVLIEEKLDRTVYNAEQDKSLTGGDATDAMRRVPLLSVDVDGNVTLRGSANIKVLINNKPSTITANNLADALKQIPLDQIRSIEVITSPSVKYEADGSAGIINIVLKQDRLHGVLVNPDMAIGTRASFLGIDGAYNNKKMAFSIGGFGRATYHVTGTYDNVQATGSETIRQQAATRKNELASNYNLGWDYDIDKHNFLNASVRYSQLDRQTHQNGLLSNFYDGAVLDSTLLNGVEVTGRSGTVDATLDLTHVFAKGREFSFLTLFSLTDATNGFTNVQQDPADGSLIGRLGNEDRSSNQEITLQADYQTPLDSNQLLGFGAKQIFREVISDYDYELAVGGDPLIVETSPGLTNRFGYHQNVESGYLEYTLNTRSRFSFRAGARYEYTAISAGLREPGVALPQIPSYGVFLPAVNLGWRLKNGKLIRLGFTRRIQRPSLLFLNPNRVASDPGGVSTGNPALGPEYADNIELGYNTAVKDMSIGFSGFFRHSTRAIESVSLALPGGDTIERTYANIGRESTAGLNVFASLDLGQQLSLSGGADLYYSDLSADGRSPAGHNTGWVFSARLSGGYNFSKTWSLYLYSYYRGSQVLLQGYQTGYPYYSLTLKRQLPKKRGTIGLGAENFLSRGISLSTNLRSAGLSQSTTNLNHTLSLRIYMSFTFGKLRVEREERSKKAVDNDDLKKG
jgi:outer membrane receptor protein involved in Fe transport